MVGCEKEVSLNVTELPSENNCKIKSIHYRIESSVPVSLSHSITLNQVELEVDRMYVLRGKSKM